MNQISIWKIKYFKKLIIAETKFDCSSSINLLAEFPVLDFRCIINSLIKEILKKFDVSYKKKNELLFLNIRGNLNILKNKIGFDYIGMNNGYNATEEDLKYFKSTFENILLYENFLNIFDLPNIKKFVLEIS